MLRIAAEGDVSAMLAIYRPYVLTSTAAAGAAFCTLAIPLRHAASVV